MAQTDVLVGVHGAGLTQLIFMPNDSFVFEITSPPIMSRIHFRLFCNWLGHSYYLYPDAIIDPVDDPNEEVFIPYIKTLEAGIIDIVAKAREKKCSENNCITNGSPPLWNPEIVL